MSGKARTRRLAVAGSLAISLALALVVSASGAISADLVSRNSQGVSANGSSGTTQARNISANGRFVAFDAKATNLPGGSGTYFLPYLRDMQTGKTMLMARKQNGQPATGAAVIGGISANADVVSFEGAGTGLPGADPDNTEVWIRDRPAGVTRLVSRANNGDPADGADSVEPTVSSSGRFVAFESAASNLPAGGHGEISRAYVRDMKLGQTILVSRTSAGQAVYARMCGQAISSDGSRVVFFSDDPRLPGANGYDHIYLRDLAQNRTTLIDRRSNGTVATGDDSACPSISDNGRSVTFNSFAPNLPGVTPPDTQQFLRDTRTGRLFLVSRSNTGKPANGSALYGQPSGDGTLVTFQASATNLPGGSALYDQAYVRDMQRGRTKLLSKTDNGDPGDSGSSDISISLDGRWAAFTSDASNLGATPPDYSVFRAGPMR